MKLKYIIPLLVLIELKEEIISTSIGNNLKPDFDVYTEEEEPYCKIF